MRMKLTLKARDGQALVKALTAQLGGPGPLTVTAYLDVQVAELPGTCDDARAALKMRVVCCPSCHDGAMLQEGGHDAGYLQEVELPGGARAAVCCQVAAVAERSPA